MVTFQAPATPLPAAPSAAVPLPAVPLPRSGLAQPPAPRWRLAELVAGRAENPHTRTLTFDVPGWPGHLPGQHVDVRVTSDDGYQAARSYSLAAPVAGDRVELTVQRLRDGEVSPYLVDGMRPGAKLHILGPLGGWPAVAPAGDPVLLVAGGIGIVPLMATLRARRAAGGGGPVRLLYSLRSPEWLCYASELRGDPAVTVAYTRLAPLAHPRPAARLTVSEISARGLDPADEPSCYICGPNGFVDAMTTMLTKLGHDPARITTERFAPSAALTLTRT